MSERTTEIQLDDNGFPVMLAIKPGQVADQGQDSGVVVRRGAKSGNPNADAATGRFQKKGEQTPVPVQENPVAVNRSGLPQGVTQEEWERRLDAVRDAAREMDAMDAGDAREFLAGRVKDLSQVDLDQFLIDVRAQRLDDMTDIFDHQLRTRVEGMRRSRRFVRVQAPKGWSQRVFKNLTDDEMVSLVRRLGTRGWETEDLNKHVVGKISDEERRTKILDLLGEGSKSTKKEQS